MAKNGVEIYFDKNSINLKLAHAAEPKPTQKVLSWGPLSIGIFSISTASKMENFKKKEKLKNRDLIKFPFII